MKLSKRSSSSLSEIIIISSVGCDKIRKCFFTQFGLCLWNGIYWSLSSTHSISSSSNEIRLLLFSIQIINIIGHLVEIWWSKCQQKKVYFFWFWYRFPYDKKINAFSEDDDQSNEQSGSDWQNKKNIRSEAIIIDQLKRSHTHVVQWINVTICETEWFDMTLMMNLLLHNQKEWWSKRKDLSLV